MFDSPLISGDVLREIITKAPRNLDNLDAELLFIDRNYIFHYLEGNRHVYKSLTPDVLCNAFNQDYTEGKSKRHSNIIDYLKLLNRKVKVSSRCRYPVSDLVPIQNQLNANKAVEIVIKNAECK